jgi:lysozyme
LRTENINSKPFNLFTMQKRLIILLCLLLSAQFSIYAKKHHHGSSRGHKSRITHRHTKHKVRDTRPTISIKEVDLPENVWGIDVSHHQAEINWDLIGEQKPHFMFIKASEGTTIQDTRYPQNYTEAKKHGIMVGSYHFFSYKSSGKEQADNFLSVAQHKNGDLLPVLDAEFTKQMPDKNQVSNELTDFTKSIYEKLGHYPIIYCNYKYYSLYLTDFLKEKCKLWIVDYQNQPSCDWTFWQKTNKFKISGIKGLVDLNLFNGSRNNLQNLMYQKTIN